MHYNLFCVVLLQSVLFESCVTVVLCNLRYSIFYAYAFVLYERHACFIVFELSLHSGVAFLRSVRTTIIIFHPLSLFLPFLLYIRHVTCACDSLSFYYVRCSLFCVFLVVCCVVLYTISTLLTAHIRSAQKYPVMRGESD